MTQVETIKAWLNDMDVTDAQIEVALDMAAGAILDRRFGSASVYPDRPSEVEECYKRLQTDMAIELLARMGTEGEVGHSEQGVSQTYNSAWISKELLSRVIPKAVTF